MMQTMAIIGTQWGDEGKGKITDLLGQKADLVIRYQGGNNAGHTIVVKDQTTILHTLPSGVLHKHCLSIIGQGVVVDPVELKKEIDDVQKTHTITPEQLKISINSSVITSYHKLLDQSRETEAKEKKIGTTGKGIGPCYEDKVARKGLKMGDLRHKETIYSKLKGQLDEKQTLFQHQYKCSYPTLEEETQRLYELGQYFQPYLDNTYDTILNAYKDGKKLLYEGAQGALLDVDFGTYPYVTSSHTVMPNIYIGAGIPNGKQLQEVLGIVKAYTTRVGNGPFPTELTDSIGQGIQKKGHEFGATTGRPRRCGWPDLPLLRYAIKTSHISSMAITKLDVLEGLEELKICYAYEYEGQTYDSAFPGMDLAKVNPLYKTIPGFKTVFSQNKLTQEVLNYVELLEAETQCPVGMLAYGPERDQIVLRKEYLELK